MNFRAPLLILLCSSLSACDWVDSKGNQPSNDQLAIIVDGGQLLLLENSPRAATFTGDTNSISGWQWRAIGARRDSNCAINNGFDNTLAAESLQQACTNQNDCTIRIEELAENGQTQFSIMSPSLQAPLAIDYIASATDEQGNFVELDQTLCMVAVNEAPLANDDQYTVLRNLTREVSAQDPDSLLANDHDDLDIRNQPLRINPTPLEAPRYANDFQLGTDGSFIYTPSDAINQSDDVLEDKFVYQLTDGVHQVPATVRLRIVSNNVAPIRIERTDLITLSIEEYGDTGFSVNLADNFFDADEDTLTFTVSDGSLPTSGHISLSKNGLLSGTPTNSDLGDYIVTVIASDGIGQAADTFILSITRFIRQNSAPEVDDIPNRTVRNNFSYNVANYFFDEDGDEMSFEASGLPSGVSISSAGLIRGTANGQNRGAWFITVTANDGRGGITSDAFRLTIR